MAVYQSMQELIGNTPLVRPDPSWLSRRRLGPLPSWNLWNPSGPVKDRTGLYMVRDAEKQRHPETRQIHR